MGVISAGATTVQRASNGQVSHYARAHDTTLTRLVTHYLERVSVAQDPLAHAPIVRRLSGSLPPQVSIDDYRQHLQDKYGRQD